MNRHDKAKKRLAQLMVPKRPCAQKSCRFLAMPTSRFCLSHGKKILKKPIAPDDRVPKGGAT